MRAGPSPMRARVVRAVLALGSAAVAASCASWFGGVAGSDVLREAADPALWDGAAEATSEDGGDPAPEGFEDEALALEGRKDVRTDASARVVGFTTQGNKARKPVKRREAPSVGDVREGPAALGLATSLAKRMRGLLLSRPDEGALLLLPCADVHTVGMGRRIDVAFVDGTGCVLAAYRDVGPFRRLRHRGAAAVVERFSSCATPWFEPGDRMGVVPVKEGAR